MTSSGLAQVFLWGSQSWTQLQVGFHQGRGAESPPLTFWPVLDAAQDTAGEWYPQICWQIAFPNYQLFQVNYSQKWKSLSGTRPSSTTSKHSPLARDDLECLNSTLILEIILLTPDEIHPGWNAFSASALFCVSPCWDSSKLPYIFNRPHFFIVFFKS